MAENTQNNNPVQGLNLFTKGINKDIANIHDDTISWSYARNTINFTQKGDFGTLSNEPSNKLCVSIEIDGQPATIVGLIYLLEEKWCVFSTVNEQPWDGKYSEIGIFDKTRCQYIPVVRSKCLSFSPHYPITGVSKRTGKCEYNVYWADGYNPDRTINLGNNALWPATPQDRGNIATTPWLNSITSLPYITTDNTNTPCNDYEPVLPLDIDCNRIRLNLSFNQPCVVAKRGTVGGTLPSGVYYASIAYMIDGNVVTDYYTSLPAHLFSENNTGLSLDIKVDNIDGNAFTHYQLVVTSIVNQQTRSKVVGIYQISNAITSQVINVSSIDPTTIDIPIELILNNNIVYTKSEKISQVNNYMIRISPTTNLEPNYQPLANLIETSWFVAEYPETYYYQRTQPDGAIEIDVVGYLKDEVYDFQIRWVYDTGDKTPLYHIPGRCSNITYCGANREEQANNAIINQVYSGNYPKAPDGGNVIMEGWMGVYESTEKYDMNNRIRWNFSDFYGSTKKGSDIRKITIIYPYGSNAQCVDLCGKNIRLHRFPADNLDPGLANFNPANNKVRYVGVRFKNIYRPVDNNGNFIPNIVGYELFRSLRNGHKTIIAKGYLKGVNKEKEDSNDANYFPNFPVDPYAGKKIRTLNKVLNRFTFSIDNTWNITLSQPDESNVYSIIDSLNYTFHSIDTSFDRPYANWTYLRYYGDLHGFDISKYYTHDELIRYKVLSPLGYNVAKLQGLVSTLLRLNGEYSLELGGHRIKASSETGNVEAVGTGGDVLGIATFTAGAIAIGATMPFLQNMNAFINDASGSGMLLALNLAGYSMGDMVNNINKAQDIYSAMLAAIGQGHFHTPRIRKNKPGLLDGIPKKLRSIIVVPLMLNLLDAYVLDNIKLLKAGLPYQDVILMNAHYAYLNNYLISRGCNIYSIQDSVYLSPHILSYKGNVINNLYRIPSVFIKTSNPVPKWVDDNTGMNIDITQCCSKKISIDLKDDNKMCDTQATGSVRYVSLKVENHRAYGQLYNTKKVPISCIIDVGPYKPNGRFVFDSGYLFGGDTFVSRYTEKDNFLYFTDFPTKRVDVPDGYEFNYLKHRNILFPRFWLNAQEDGKDIIDPEDKLLDAGCQGNGADCNGINHVLTQYFYDDAVVSVYASVLCFMNNISAGLQKICDKAISGLGSFISSSVSDDCSGLGCIVKIVKMMIAGLALVALIAVAVACVIANFIVNAFTTIVNIFTIIATSLISALTSFGSSSPGYYKTSYVPYSLEGCYKLCKSNTTKLLSSFALRGLFFYLNTSTVIDVWLESEYHMAWRLKGKNGERFFHPYNDNNLKDHFEPKTIKAGDVFFYDNSFLPSVYGNIMSGFYELQSIFYNPTVSEYCFKKDKNKVIYSLGDQNATYIDNWRVFLPLNYKTFTDVVTGIYPILDSGAIILFRNTSPGFIQGVDTIQTQAGINITTGTGGLFAQPIRSASNADKYYEYGSVQDHRSVINTPFGIYYTSNNLGKIFQYSPTQLKEISMQGINIWSSKYMRFKMVEEFPYIDRDTNVLRLYGAHSFYDNKYSIVYFCKRDYEIRKDIKEKIDKGEIKIVYMKEYFYNNTTLLNAFVAYDTTVTPNTIIDVFQIRPDDNTWMKYLKDISITLSYDAKNGAFISFHDWRPHLGGGSMDHFFTTKDNAIWIHNNRCDDFCNYYGQYYPFEIEAIIDTGTNVNILRSLEYYLEAYKYGKNCYDFHHELDYNFDKLIIHNTEQCSGVLNLVMKNKVNPFNNVGYPKYNVNSVSVLYEKVENKYRVNGFYDLIKDRGEYSGNDKSFILFEDNGYIRTLDNNEIDYNKSPLERKRFRHYVNKLWFIKEADWDPAKKVFKFDKKMIMNLMLLKQIYSVR